MACSSASAAGFAITRATGTDSHPSWRTYAARSSRIRTQCVLSANRRGGAERNIEDPHEISRGALLIDRRLVKGAISRVDVHGDHQAVEVSGQAWPGHLDHDRVAHANSPMRGPHGRPTLPSAPTGPAPAT